MPFVALAAVALVVFFASRATLAPPPEQAAPEPTTI